MDDNVLPFGLDETFTDVIARHVLYSRRAVLHCIRTTKSIDKTLVALNMAATQKLDLSTAISTVLAEAEEEPKMTEPQFKVGDLARRPASIQERRRTCSRE